MPIDSEPLGVRKIIELVTAHFEGDAVKAVVWFVTPNPNFDNVIPALLIANSRFYKLQSIVERLVVQQ